MTTPDGPGADIAQLIQSIKDNAQRYGLTWQIVRATVIDGSDTDMVVLQYDGDDSITPGAISVLGSQLVAGSRVYVMQVPPAGNYIIGFSGVGSTQFQSRMLLNQSQPLVIIPVLPGLRNLRMVWSARSDAAVQVALVSIQIGSDATAVYGYENYQANNAALVAGGNVGSTSGPAGLCTGALTPAGVFGSGVVDFQSWDRTAISLGWTWTSEAIGSTAANGFNQAGGGRYTGSKLRNALTITCGTGNFIAGSDFQLTGDRS